ncbi:hypothetical protein [Schaalia vaccimaxillae]|uniref:hypothetical protein n=1 Tax=Schaalia vaccimaxillae TaxID=183916 RepID=UPI0003B69935|nr:hypothetical protein [Schaalia vaccimaxillae]
MHDERVNGMRSSVKIPAKKPLWRDPRLLGGLILIALSIAACTWLVADARSGDLVYKTTRPVAQGERLDSTNTQIVEARPGTNAYLLDGQLPSEAVAARSIGADELIASSAVATENDLTRRRLVVTVADGLPESVQTGDLLELWALPGAYATSEKDAQSSLIAANVILVSVEETGSVVRGGTRIEVLIPQDTIAAVLDATSGPGALAAVPIGG